MMKITTKRSYKSLKFCQPFTLPDFTVLTGKNGSGKSHFLEAMCMDSIIEITADDNHLSNIRYIPFNGLNPDVAKEANYRQIQTAKENLWKEIHEHITKIQKGYLQRINFYLSLHAGKTKNFTILYELAGKNLGKLTKQFVYDHYYAVNEDLLAGRLAELFKAYHINLDDNDYNTFLNNTRGEHNPVLSDEEFTKRYGPKPWDFINDILARINLPLRVNHPTGDKENPFVLNIRDENTGIEVIPNDLSTGEKVLLSLATSIYGTEETKAKVDVLLIDEPDAGLHPEFSKALIEVLQKHIVEKAGVKVVITTHNPTTVALAPEESIHKMVKDQGAPEKVSKKDAIDILVKDLDFLRLTLENRRQIIVESGYDVDYYSLISKLLANKPALDLQFLSVGKLGDGSNCEIVKKLVKDLREKGNDTVYGIIDHDNNNESNEFVFVMGEGKRYAIENYILDPIFVGLTLVRGRIVEPADMRLPYASYMEMHIMKHDEVEKIISYVTRKLGLNDGNSEEVEVQNGEKYCMPSAYLHMKGHDLEDKIKEKWPVLKGIAKNQDNLLKEYIIKNVINDSPQYISKDFSDLFDKIS